DSHGRPRMRRSREIVVERRDLTVLEDLVAAGDTDIDVFVRSDLDVDLIADLEFGQSLRSGIAAQQNLAVGGDIGIARLVVETGDLCDRAVDDGGPGDFGGHVVRTADWTVEGVVAPRLVVDADRVRTQLGIVQPPELRLLAVVGERS